jgi:transposase
MQGLPLQVQEGLKRGPHGGDLFIFRGRRGDLAKILSHNGIGLSLYASFGKLNRRGLLGFHATSRFPLPSRGTRVYATAGFD